MKNLLSCHHRTCFFSIKGSLEVIKEPYASYIIFQLIKITISE